MNAVSRSHDFGIAKSLDAFLSQLQVICRLRSCYMLIVIPTERINPRGAIRRFWRLVRDVSDAAIKRNHCESVDARHGN